MGSPSASWVGPLCVGLVGREEGGSPGGTTAWRADMRAGYCVSFSAWRGAVAPEMGGTRQSMLFWGGPDLAGDGAGCGAVGTDLLGIARGRATYQDGRL